MMRITKVRNKQVYRAWVSDFDREMAKKLGIPFQDYVKLYVEQTLKRRWMSDIKYFYGSIFTI